MVGGEPAHRAWAAPHAAGGHRAVRQRPAAGAARDQEPGRPECRHLEGIRPAADVQGADSRHFSVQRAAGHLRRHRGADGLALGQWRTLHGVAHHRRRHARPAGRVQRAANTGTRCVGPGVFAGLPALLRVVRRGWWVGRHAGEEDRGLPPVPRGARGHRAGGGCVAARCGQWRAGQGRRGVAHAGQWQEHHHDVFRRACDAGARDGQPDHRGHHRPQ